MSLREDVLRGLVAEYQKDRNPIVFERILKRVDHLLLKTIRMWVEIRPHLGYIDLRDLYHSSIVGLGRALLTARPQESGGIIVARIISYVRNEINIDYPLRRRKRRCFILPEKRISASISYDSLLELEQKLELEEIAGRCCCFLTDDVVDLFVKKFVQGKNAYQIAKEEHCSPQNINQKLQYWLKRIRMEVNNGTSD